MITCRYRELCISKEVARRNAIKSILRLAADLELKCGALHFDVMRKLL